MIFCSDGETEGCRQPCSGRVEKRISKLITDENSVFENMRKRLDVYLEWEVLGETSQIPFLQEPGLDTAEEVAIRTYITKKYQNSASLNS